MNIQAYKPKDIAALKAGRRVLQAHVEAIRSDDADAARSEVWYLERFLDAIDYAIEEREALQSSPADNPEAEVLR